MKTLIITAVVALAPAMGFAMGCGPDHEDRTTAASCAAGKTWDSKSGSCVDQTSS